MPYCVHILESARIPRFPTMLSEGRAGLSEGGWDFSVYPLVRALVLPETSQPALLGRWRCFQRFDVTLWN